MYQPTEKIQAELRRRELLKILERQENVNTLAVARHFGVNPMTIRRDLQMLEKTGQVLRCYGGAVAAQRITFEFEFDERQNHNLECKRRIGQAAAELVEAGQAVFLDTGTTTLEVARALARRDIACSVFTCSLVVASELWGRSRIELNLLGGRVRQGSPDLVGPVTEMLVDRFTADLAFIGADGIDFERGCFVNDAEIAGISERMSSHARRLIVVADHDKLDRSGRIRHIGMEDFKELITDDQADKATVAALRQHGVHVTVV